jgi:hypothetical protein
MEDKKRRARRYRLHHRIRKQGFRLITRERTIYLIVNELASKQVKILKNEFGDSLQLEYE